MAKTYFEKLQDPRWQKKRLEILNRDEFTCQSCFDKDNMLQVHHIKYNSEPWLTNSDYLICLCVSCHNSIEKSKNEVKAIFEELQSNLNIDGFYELVDIIRSISNKNLNPYELSAINKFINNFTDKDYQKYFKKYCNK